MNCLSRPAPPRAFARVVGAVGTVAVVILVAAGAWLALSTSAAHAGPAPTPPPDAPRDSVGPDGASESGPVAEVVDLKAGIVDQIPDQALPGDEAAIVFTGSAMAPLVCSSTPDTTAITITDSTRITLANLTGAVATVDTGTSQELTVADGVGISVLFRPGQYAVRMVPDCTMTSGVDAAVLTVTAAADSPSGSLPDGSSGATQPPSVPSGSDTSSGTGPSDTTGADPDGSGGDPSVLVGPDATAPIGGTGDTGTTARPSSGTGPSAQEPTGQGQLGSRPRGSGSSAQGSSGSGSSGSGTGPGASGQDPFGRGQGPTIGPQNMGAGPSGPRATVSPSRSVALPAGPEAVIYDVVLIPLPDRGDPRDARLLAVIAVICVFGVTMAIIRAILTQRARRVVST